MAFAVSDCHRETQRISRYAIVFIALALCAGGCSFNLGSLSSEDEAPKAISSPAVGSPGPNKNDVEAANAATKRGKTLARAGKNEAALEEFNNAINLDPHTADALYNRGLLYQREKQHEQAIEDFTAANGLIPQHAEPLLARANSYLALDKAREAANDLDEAAQFSPQNAQIWSTRGLVYERLGDKMKAAGSYSRAMALRPKDEAARNAFLRVGGKEGQSYDAF